MQILKMISDIPDMRMPALVQHNLSSIIFVALCGILCGCEDWSDLQEYCRVKKDWLSRYVSLENGIPSSDTFRRVFTSLDPDNVETLLRTHASEIVANNKASDQIAIDGKALRGSKRLDTGCLTSVSAWCHENELVLAEKQTDSKSNEITAIPLLLESMALKKNYCYY